MNDEEAEARKLLQFKILFGLSGKLLTTFEPDERLCLGENFELRSKRLWGDLEEHRTRLIRELSDYPFERLAAGFDRSGRPVEDWSKDWISMQTAELKSKYRSLDVWDYAPFSSDGDLANYKHWGKASYLKLDEALFLSVGLEPKKHFVDALERPTSGRRVVDKVADFLCAKRDLFRRGLDPNDHNRRHEPSAILEWIERVELEVHPAFARMLQTAIGRKSAPAPSSVSHEVEDGQGKFDAREKRSLATILVAMAIAEYGYDPTARRSPIPKEISDIAALLGLDITAETIRTYLQLGARYLPDDWKPTND